MTAMFAEATLTVDVDIEFPAFDNAVVTAAPPGIGQVTDLVVDRIGDEVQVRWAPPSDLLTYVGTVDYTVQVVSTDQGGTYFVQALSTEDRDPRQVYVRVTTDALAFAVAIETTSAVGASATSAQVLTALPQPEPPPQIELVPYAFPPGRAFSPANFGKHVDEVPLGY